MKGHLIKISPICHSINILEYIYSRIYPSGYESYLITEKNIQEKYGMSFAFTVIPILNAKYIFIYVLKEFPCMWEPQNGVWTKFLEIHGVGKLGLSYPVFLMLISINVGS